MKETIGNTRKNRHSLAVSNIPNSIQVTQSGQI